MEPDFMSRIMNAGKDHMMNVYEEAKRMQPNKPGHIIRTENEQAKIFQRIQNLDRDERQSVMEDMAKKAGHKGDQLDGCEVCQFVVKHAKKNRQDN